MVVTNSQLNVVLAAGGNPTGVVCFPDSSHRSDYSRIAKDFMSGDPSIEQFGFLEGKLDFHFQMSGGEFCGNAARAAALLISKSTSQKHGQFTVSGFNGIVSYHILDNGEVECKFPDLQMRKSSVTVLGIQADLVDMGGIVHVVLPFDYPFDTSTEKYREIHREITQSLSLGNRPAVGVIWREKKDDGSIAIHPVVWVKDIDSFFYETACGSGTLATLVAGDSSEGDILQPSGQCIYAEKQGENVFVLRSRMQIQERNRT